MSEEHKPEVEAEIPVEEAPETSEVNKVEAAAMIEEQDKKVAALAKALEDNPSASIELELDRETDLLRHLRQVQKGDPKDRAAAKAEYASKAALSRAVQPVED
ncbi:MAG: hypothetical protein IPM63_09730 [Acidobacteriota bacterium]|nr:MAG: hypothetical protein IPM63_09730 [Acidobacteriota bacterium]